jgi:integrase
MIENARAAAINTKGAPPTRDIPILAAEMEEVIRALQSRGNKEFARMARLQLIVCCRPGMIGDLAACHFRLGEGVIKWQYLSKKDKAKDIVHNDPHIASGKTWDKTEFDQLKELLRGKSAGEILHPKFVLNKYTTALNEAYKETGVESKYGKTLAAAYTVRHTGVAIKRSKGISEQELQELLGHKSPTSQKVYGRETKRLAAVKFQEKQRKKRSRD